MRPSLALGPLNRRRVRVRPGVSVERQAGAIPYARVGEEITYLLITSRGTGKWLFPKGSPIDGLSPAGVAEREALEEAGVSGEVEPDPVGSYRDWKTSGMRRRPIDVTLFALRVDRQLEDWPEARMRYRHWAMLAEAQRLLANRELVVLLDRLEQRLLRAGSYGATAKSSTR